MSCFLSGLQAIWTRFFPVVEALRSVLAQGDLGDLRVARAEFGLNITHVPRAIDWAQAGGALLDVGIYCVQFLSMVFQGQKPEKILAVGRRYETGRVLRGAFDGGVSAPGLLCLGSPLGGSTRDAAVGSPAWPGAAQALRCCRPAGFSSEPVCLEGFGEGCTPRVRGLGNLNPETQSAL